MAGVVIRRRRRKAPETSSLVACETIANLAGRNDASQNLSDAAFLSMESTLSHLEVSIGPLPMGAHDLFPFGESRELPGVMIGCGLPSLRFKVGARVDEIVSSLIHAPVSGRVLRRGCL